MADTSALPRKVIVDLAPEGGYKVTYFEGETLIAAVNAPNMADYRNLGAMISAWLDLEAFLEREGQTLE